MDLFGLKELLAPFYARQSGELRADHPERVAAIATRWQKETEEPLDGDLILAMSYLYSITDQVSTQHRVRVGIEAWFVEQGWGNAKIRGLMRAAERLPDEPKSFEEKLVADADTLCRLGLLGLTRALLRGGAEGRALEEILSVAQKDLYRRAYTAPGHTEIVPLKARLRDLLEELRST
ncbi:MAG: hypothetical protein AAF658_04865 [Myxococcota bacterium]